MTINKRVVLFLFGKNSYFPVVSLWKAMDSPTSLSQKIPASQHAFWPLAAYRKKTNTPANTTQHTVGSDCTILLLLLAAFLVPCAHSQNIRARKLIKSKLSESLICKYRGSIFLARSCRSNSTYKVQIHRQSTARVSEIPHTAGDTSSLLLSL
jgi:hypothetical protein